MATTTLKQPKLMDRAAELKKNLEADQIFCTLEEARDLLIADFLEKLRAEG